MKFCNGLLVAFLFFIWTSCSTSISDPQFATGKIYDGVQNTYKYDDGRETKGKTVIKYVYQSKDGKMHNSTEQIDEDAFEHVFKDQFIQLVYSKKEPHISVPLVDIETVNKYVDQENRNLELSDIYKLIDIDSSKAIERELNSISYKWSYQKEDSTELWYNMPFNESVYRTGSGTIAYMTRSNKMFMRMRSKMKNSGYEEMLNLGQGHQIWKSDTHLAESSVNVSSEGFGRKKTTQYVYSISFLKSENDISDAKENQNDL